MNYGVIVLMSLHQQSVPNGGKWLDSGDHGVLMLIDMFGLLLGRFNNNYYVRFVLMTDTMGGYPSRGIASLFHVGSTERARIDVFSNDIDSLLLSLFCTDSYSRRLIHEGNIYYLK
jgi:hypothetical protein